MKQNGKRRMTTVELGKTLDRKLQRFARREDLTLSQVVRKAVRSFIAENKSLPSPSTGS